MLGATWNCRSLWSQNNTKTIDFVFYKLLHAHDFVTLTETRETRERRAFLDSRLPTNIQYYSSSISQHEGGIAIAVRAEFIGHFTTCRWTIIEKGRLGRLELVGLLGTLHIYVVYLDPASNHLQAGAIRKLSRSLEDNVHNLITGDFSRILDVAAD